MHAFWFDMTDLGRRRSQDKQAPRSLRVTPSQDQSDNPTLLRCRLLCRLRSNLFDSSIFTNSEVGFCKQASQQQAALPRGTTPNDSPPNFHPQRLVAMCQTEFNKSFTCGHKWMTIVRECRPGIGFNQHLHHYTPARSGFFQPKYLSAAANSCPNCDKKGEYDWNKTRMILDYKSDRGTLGNGYTMTDGYGRPLPGYWNPYQPGTRVTSCGITRISQPRQEPGCGCTVM